MHWIYLIHEFHNLSWITEINELFQDILIYWDAPVVTTFYFKDLDRNVVEWKVQYLSFKCSEVKVVRFQKNNTQVKNRYSKSVLKYNTQVNVLSYCPSLLRNEIKLKICQALQWCQLNKNINLLSWKCRIMFAFKFSWKILYDFFFLILF